MKCAWHCCKNEVIGRSNKIFCSKTCVVKSHVNVKRKRLKQQAVEYLGGKCSSCGYSKCVQALDFHHVNPEEKSFGIASKGHTRSWDRLRIELNKCILLCANCHREIEAEIDKFNVVGYPSGSRGLTVNQEA